METMKRGSQKNVAQASCLFFKSKTGETPVLQDALDMTGDDPRGPSARCDQ